MKILNRKGQDILEYALIMGLIVIAIVASMKLFGNTLGDMFTNLNNYLATVS